MSQRARMTRIRRHTRPPPTSAKEIDRWDTRDEVQPTPSAKVDPAVFGERPVAAEVDKEEDPDSSENSGPAAFRR